MKCPTCGKYISMTVVPYQRIHRDKETGRWTPNSDICQCDPDDICLWGLIKKKEARDAREKAKEESQ